MIEQLFNDMPCYAHMICSHISKQQLNSNTYNIALTYRNKQLRMMFYFIYFQINRDNEETKNICRNGIFPSDAQSRGVGGGGGGGGGTFVFKVSSIIITQPLLISMWV